MWFFPNLHLSLLSGGLKMSYLPLSPISVFSALSPFFQNSWSDAFHLCWLTRGTLLRNLLAALVGPTHCRMGGGVAVVCVSWPGPRTKLGRVFLKGKFCFCPSGQMWTEWKRPLTFGERFLGKLWGSIHKDKATEASSLDFNSEDGGEGCGRKANKQNGWFWKMTSFYAHKVMRKLNQLDECTHQNLKGNQISIICCKWILQHKLFQKKK